MTIKTEGLTLNGLESWLKTQDPETRYNYLDNADCLVARYAKHLGFEDDIVVIPGHIMRAMDPDAHYPIVMDHVARDCGVGSTTYGEVLKRIETARADEALGFNRHP